jgi:hypothetical protein
METIQEYLDEAVKRMVKQGERCMSKANTGICGYTDDTGKNHCAVGWILALYSKNQQKPMPCVDDSLGAPRLLDRYPDIFPPCFKNSHNLLSHFQSFHDFYSSSNRHEILNFLKGKSIDTSGAHWEQWVEMGK